MRGKWNREKWKRACKKLDKVTEKLENVEENLDRINRRTPQENYRCWIKNDPVQNETNELFWPLWHKKQTYTWIQNQLVRQIVELEMAL